MHYVSDEMESRINMGVCKITILTLDYETLPSRNNVLTRFKARYAYSFMILFEKSCTDAGFILYFTK